MCQGSLSLDSRILLFLSPMHGFRGTYFPDEMASFGNVEMGNGKLMSPLGYVPDFLSLGSSVNGIYSARFLTPMNIGPTSLSLPIGDISSAQTLNFP